MEHVLNAKERNRAFAIFIACFLLVTSIIVMSVYFDFRIPSRENEMLREEVNSYENQIFHQQQLITAVQTARNLIDSMGKSAHYNALLDREIAKQLEIIKSPEYQDSSIYATMNKDIFNLIYDYNELNKNLLGSKDALQQVEKLKDELNRCENKLEKTELSLETYRKSNNLGL